MGWIGKVAAGTSTLSLAITDKNGGKTTQERAIHNNLYGAYSRAVEYDKDKNRLLLTSWSSDRLMELNLTQNTLQELPIGDRAIKNLLAGTQFLSYLPSSQTLYFPNYLNGSIAKFNLNTSSIEQIEGSQGSQASMLCVHRNTGDVFNTSLKPVAKQGLRLLNSPTKAINLSHLMRRHYSLKYNSLEYPASGTAPLLPMGQIAINWPYLIRQACKSLNWIYRLSHPLLPIRNCALNPLVGVWLFNNTSRQQHCNL